MFEKPKAAVMGLRKPLVITVAVGLQTKMWGLNGVRQYEGHRVIKSYFKVSITCLNSSHFRTLNYGHMYTVSITLCPACVGQVQKDEVCCQEEATYDPECAQRPHMIDGHSSYVPESIAGHHEAGNGAVLYGVKWIGYECPTWELESDLYMHGYLLAAYHDTIQTKVPTEAFVVVET
ncbi:hypothetical protein BDP55DRAFT_738597 [Colletotrichum godetiae]|uniref:Chromo domain-containing protein n=1 Tax=Colletotrichum godetiae TaxID=1209918 RepID=A0AAJ0A6F1_9PEZI|nr:uncharacterized protein BDP55DRAFT_738597 [Colletotrichum godetiae]KAK1656939.1 hypothetical protein BDP55DRAFT_738597 [Colletotrichum godetiae]